jgi:diguanylate cyclase (GGDEF)-like protein
MASHRRRSVVPVLLLVGAVTVACLALLSIRHFRSIARGNTDALHLIAEIRSDASHRNALEWQAIAKGRVDRAALFDLDVAGRTVTAKIDRFGVLQGRADAEPLARVFGDYEAAVAAEFRHLAAGRTEEAEAVDEERVDPTFTALGYVLDHAGASAHRKKAEAERAERMASWSIGSGALLIIVALMGGFVRVRNREVAQRAYQEALTEKVRVSEQRATEREHEANHDPLTDLPNRRYFMRRLDAEVDRLEKGHATIAVMLIDLDHFKDVNDTLGHRAGDEVLRQVGERLRSVLRDEDVLARLGGDEFAILVPASRAINAEGALTLADRIHTALEGSFLVDGLPLSITGSIGIAIGPADGEEAATLLQHADVAMYGAKDLGDGSHLYRPDNDRNSREQLLLPGELRDALANDQIVLHYQPKLDLLSGDVIGVEALVRWQHPRRGLLGPHEFLPIAERSGMMRQLTSTVLGQALTQTGVWCRAGLDLRVAVNLSATDLQDEALPHEIAGLLSRHGVDGTRLQLEVTENVFVTAPERVAAIVGRLAELGVMLSLDDFGTGYSSLAHLRSLSVDELKIDRSFVSKIVSNAFDTAVVRSTVDLAHSLHLRVVGEGVEDVATLDELREQGCDEAQGYFIRRPGPANELTPWLREHLKARSNATLA